MVLIGQSPHAHALIRGMDLTAVEAAPGIVCVMTAEDVPGVNDCGPVVHDDPIFAVEKVSFVGQSVFAIVAENMAAARAALPLAYVDYDLLPAILTIDAAMEVSSFLGPPKQMIKGEPDKHLASAPRQLSVVFIVVGKSCFILKGKLPWQSPVRMGTCNFMLRPNTHLKSSIKLQKCWEYRVMP